MPPGQQSFALPAMPSSVDDLLSIGTPRVNSTRRAPRSTSLSQAGHFTDDGHDNVPHISSDETMACAQQHRHHRHIPQEQGGYVYTPMIFHFPELSCYHYFAIISASQQRVSFFLSLL